MVLIVVVVVKFCICTSKAVKVDIPLSLPIGRCIIHWDRVSGGTTPRGPYELCSGTTDLSQA